MMNADYDVIIIGAGAAGLMAANELVKAGIKVTVLEAKNRMGGRIHTINAPGFTVPIEMGAEFEHGKLEHTEKLVKEAGARLYKVGGKIWRQQNDNLNEGSDFIEDYDLLEDAFKKLKEDITVAEFFKKYLNKPEHDELKKTLHGYVEGYNAADVNKASALTLKNDLKKQGNDQFRIEGGYISIINYLAGQIKNSGASVFFDTAVHKINWKKNSVILNTTSGDFTTSKILLTVSLGVYQQELIQFSPRITSKIELAKTIGFGNVIKFIYQFKHAFWEDKNAVKVNTTPNLGFLFSEQPVPTWWSQHPKKEAILTGWIGGPGTAKYFNLDDEALAELGIASIASIYKMPKNDLKKIVVAHKIIDWKKDAETCGAYSFDTIGGKEKRKQLAQPIEETLFFAGEALAETTETGTVEAAFETGKTAAELILNSFKNKI